MIFASGIYSSGIYGSGIYPPLQEGSALDIKIASVRAILPTGSTLTDAQIQAAILAATCVIDELVLSCLAGKSQQCLDVICSYLSAHFAAVTDNSLTVSGETEPCHGGKISYGFKFGQGVKGTPFGIMANTISGGCLAEMDKTPINMFTIGAIGDDSILSQH